MEKKLSRRARQLLSTFYKDDRNEGDVNEFSSSVIAECLKARLVLICACSRPFKNARLTPKGIAAAGK